MSIMSITFSHMTTNDEGRINEIWERFIKNVVNKVLKDAFNNEGYDRYGCSATRVVIGYNDGIPVCTCGIEYWWKDKTKALLSAVGASPQNHGYGTLLMQHIVKYLDDWGIKKIYLKIDKDEKANRLEKFYSQFDFSVINKVVEDDEVFVNCDTDEEYVMFRSV
jgi:GNAT superfamily N-acetyltransferase